MTNTALVTTTYPITSIFSAILTFLEKVSDEDIWRSVLGERIVNLIQKYFGNDVVTLSLAFYIAPILKMQWTKLMEILFKRVQPPGTVSIKIYSEDSLYNTVAKYAYEHGKAKETLLTGIAEYYSPSDAIAVCTDEYDDGLWEDPSNKSETESIDSDLKVKLRPPKVFDEELVYKGNTVTIEFKEPTESSSEYEGSHIIVSMPGNDTKKLHIILQEWSNEYNTTYTYRYVYRPSGTCWVTDREIPAREMDSIHLCHGQKEQLITDLRTFKTRADWYLKRGIPYRRGYLLYGPPGTGKSSTIQALSKYLDYNVGIISNISETNNDDFSYLLKNVPYNTIVVIEDVDHLLRSATDSQVNSRMTMAGLLNIMDGIQSNSGSIIFMTCNNMNKLEPALLRPGRIDVKLKLDYAASEQIRASFWRFMGLDDITSEVLDEDKRKIAEVHADKFVEALPKHKVTTAEIQSFFIDLLLEADSKGWDRERTYEAMYERIPEFLRKVEIDREQAKKHARGNNKDDKEKESKEEKKNDEPAEKAKEKEAEDTDTKKIEDNKEIDENEANKDTSETENEKETDDNKEKKDTEVNMEKEDNKEDKDNEDNEIKATS